jgi:sulfur relay (sulfurtransferase) DsrF/TusC family protein
MAEAVCMIIRKAPYGNIHAAEAVRHINGALSSGLEPVVILVGDGVYLAQDGQEATKAGWTSLSAALGQVPGAKGGEKARFFVHQESLADRGLDHHGIMGQFKAIPGKEMAEIVAGCKKFLLF